MKLPMDKISSLINSVKGKKPIVVILSIVAIGAGLFAVQKGYITEESLNFETIINVVSDAFATTPIDSVVAPVEPIDTLAIEVVDSVITQ